MFFIFIKVGMTVFIWSRKEVVVSYYIIRRDQTGNVSVFFCLFARFFEQTSLKLETVRKWEFVHENQRTHRSRGQR